jgi:hypothetical protein
MGYARFFAAHPEEHVLARKKARAKTAKATTASKTTTATKATRSSSSKKSGGAGKAEKSAHAAGGGESSIDPPRLAACFAGFVLIALFVYGPALGGEFISDDNHYVRDNPYIQTLNFDNVVAIWNPTSVVTVAVENYAPVHLMVHGLEWQVFGPNVLGYHVVNVLLHALAAVLLIPIFRRSGIAARPALIGAALFLLHPANVESVAWISQLKSSLALVLSLGALLAHPRRPLLASVLFMLALFAKPFSAFALIVLALWGWLGSRSGDGAPASVAAGESFRWPWLLVWLAALVGFALAEVAAFSQSSGLVPPLYADPLVRSATIFAVALRYLFMAVSGLGLSTFHEPPPVDSFLDPWLLCSIMVLGLLGWRMSICFRRRSPELVFWVWAVVSFAPLSGVVPLPYPMADRYLYFVLPGLIGAVLLALQGEETSIAERMGSKPGDGRRVSQLRTAALVVAGVLLLDYAILAHARAEVYRSADALMADAERNYPNGVAANTRKASRAARSGDFESAIRYLRLAQARGYNRLDHLLQDPSYGAMRGHPEFVALQREMADEWLGRLGDNPNPSQVEARSIAQAWIVKGELEAALRVIERAIDVPGPMTLDLEGDAQELKRQIALQRRLDAERSKRN